MSKDIRLCVPQAVVVVVDSAQALFIHVSKRSVVSLPHSQGDLDLNALPCYVGFTLMFFTILSKNVSLQIHTLFAKYPWFN